MQAEMVILVVTWLILVAIQVVTPWLSRRNVLFGVVYARNSIWTTPAAKKLRRRYLAFSLTGAAILSVIGIGIAAAMHFAATALAWIQIAAFLLSISLNYALIVAAHRKSLQLLKEMGNQQELTQSKVTVDLNKLKPQTLVPAAYGIVLVPQFFFSPCTWFSANISRFMGHNFGAGG
ncbi:putative membrane protein [Lacticaseibacillus paracasei]|nr:putative membrane protein [Lacticaseibacillus paracasei]